MTTLYDKIQHTAGYLRERIGDVPDVAVILGSGLGAMADDIEEATIIPYAEIPHFPVSTVKGHSGELHFGGLGGKHILAMKGRFHFYEGYSMEEITFPVRVFAALGIPSMIVSNACGGLNRNYAVGDLMLIDDMINYLFANPLHGPNDERLGPRFPDMSRPFSKRLIQVAERVGLEHGIKLQKGVYVAVTGPNYETPAELRMFARLGGDAIGMSTVPEVIAARHNGIEEILGISVVTDTATGEAQPPVHHDEVIAAAQEAEPRFVRLVAGIIEKM